MGCATAYHLAKRGRRVLLLEQFALGHDRGSSHGHSRIIRLAYDGADYVRLAQAAYPLWRALEHESGVQLLLQTGGLDFAPPGTPSFDIDPRHSVRNRDRILSSSTAPRSPSASHSSSSSAI